MRSWSSGEVTQKTLEPSPSRDNNRPDFVGDPVEAYDRISAGIGALSHARRAYLSSIEQIVASAIPAESVSLLDIGAGDGSRALRIAQAANLKDVVLLEPSAGMRHHWQNGLAGWPIRAEELSRKSGFFDVITCLWNVIGHIAPSNERIAVLRECARLLGSNGRIFIDVNHRYNARHYGLLRTLLRMLHDLLRPNEKNGDVRVRWHLEGAHCTTNGHVFTYGELSRMVSSAGLVIEKQVTVDYTTGQILRWRMGGNLLFILKRA